MEELIALLEYLTNHNTDHAQEVEELAIKADSFGKGNVKDLLMEGVDLMNESNERLKKALTILKEN